MATSKPTLIFCHGAFHPSSAWNGLIKHLEPLCYRCLAPQLLFVGGEGTAISTWEPCVQSLQELIRGETCAGRNVVIVNHSLGSLAGSSAIEGFTRKDPKHLEAGHGSVIGIFNMAAIIIRDAEHHAQVFSKIPSNPDEAGWKPVPPPEMTRDVFFNDLDAEDAAYWISQLRPNAGWLDKSAQGLYPGYADVPVWYLIGDQDKMFPVPVQEAFCDFIREKNEAGLTVRHIDTGHAPFLKSPEATAKLIDEAAQSFAKA
ncbi:alpha/beta hydrolase family protein [Sarocladium implicatum]|nr:alpha/beta hydrolase family protein [Sarocladium implicatum]